MKNTLILITGSTDGIGKQTALDLAHMGAGVLIHGRNPERVKATLAEIEKRSPGSVKGSFIADLSSLKDVRRFAQEVRSSVDRLDVLINNAGTYQRERTLTVDGFEATFAINHLAHFLLTNELIDLIKAAGQARIITVSSVAHLRGKLEFDNLNCEKHFDPYGSYAQSKLANVMFSNELARRLDGTGVTSNSLHPGVITTKLLRIGFNMEGASLESGAATSVYLASSPSVVNMTGRYFAKSAPADPSPLASDAAVRRKLWEISEEMVAKRA